MKSLEIDQVVSQLKELHPEPSIRPTIELIKSFDKWDLVTYSVGMLGRCHWWFWDANPDLARLIRNDKSCITVMNAARRFTSLREEVVKCDNYFANKITQIGNYVSLGSNLLPLIIVRGRNPFSTQSIIEGNHRSLAICVAYLEGKIQEGNGFQVMVGRKSILGF